MNAIPSAVDRAHREHLDPSAQPHAMPRRRAGERVRDGDGARAGIAVHEITGGEPAHRVLDVDILERRPLRQTLRGRCGPVGERAQDPAMQPPRRAGEPVEAPGCPVTRNRQVDISGREAESGEHPFLGRLAPHPARRSIQPAFHSIVGAVIGAGLDVAAVDPDAG
jgi:hypothetical protein